MSMTRKARRKNKRKPKDTMPGEGGEITLCSPTAEHFPAFIFGNSTECDLVVEHMSAEGQHIVICGAGPSLRDSADEWCHQGDQLWGCNSAVTWLADNGHSPTHGFCIDQTPAMLEEWASLPDVEYLLASTVHTHLTAFLKSADKTIRFFPNWVGLPQVPVE